MKKYLVVGLVGIMLFAATGCSKTVSGGEDAKTVIGGEDAEELPARQALENAGYTVDWDNATRTILAKRDEEVQFTIDTAKGECSVMGQKPFKTSVRIENGQTFVRANLICAVQASLNSDKGFAGRLNAQMDKNTNYVFSPFSLRMAVAMAANGGNGATRNEIVSALGYSSIDELNGAMKNYVQSYNGQGAAVVNTANSLWINKTYSETEKTFSSTMDSNYKADVTRVTIPELKPALNKWVEEKSNGLQKNLDIQPNGDFAMAIVNTTYFKAKWQSEFLPIDTYEETFNSADGTKKDIDFMHDTRYVRAYRDDDISMVELKYRDDGKDLSFYAAMTDSVDPEKYIDKMTDKKVQLSLPKFKGDTTLNMNNYVKALGMNTMFDRNSADFSNIFTNKNESVFVSDILQNTVIDVDEEGTEAASTTVMMMNATSAMPEPELILIMKFDKPFTYFVRDNATGEILFMGRYAQAQ